MRLWCVEPPRGEDMGDGEDTRRWYTNRRAAEKDFNQVVRAITRHQKAMDRIGRFAYGTDRYCKAIEDADAVDPGFAYNLVELSVYEIPTTRDELVHALNGNLYPCSEVVKKFEGTET